MNTTQISTVIAGAATGALLTFILFRVDASVPEPVEATARSAVATQPRAPQPRFAATAGSATSDERPAQSAAANEPDEQESHTRAEEVPPNLPFSDGALSSWMDASLASGYADREHSDVATQQLEATLDRFPGVRLLDVQCGESLCRAWLAPQPGSALDVSAILGLPPFASASEGLTTEEADGSTKIYFVSGGSFDDLRRAAQNASEPQDRRPRS